MRALIAGPTAAERSASPGLSSAVPADTLLLGLAVSGSTATVDLSREFEAGAGSNVMARRLAQVVYTLTQFATVQNVRFQLDGQPVAIFSADGTALGGAAGRDDYLGLLPAIFLDTPAWGESVGSSGHLTGRANVFEAVFLAELTDATGRSVARRTVTASCGSGCWGRFDVTFALGTSSPGPGMVTVWVASPRDGSPENVRRYPIRLQP